jgi:hypothetical protein
MALPLGWRSHLRKGDSFRIVRPRDISPPHHLLGNVSKPEMFDRSKKKLGKSAQLQSRELGPHGQSSRAPPHPLRRLGARAPSPRAWLHAHICRGHGRINPAPTPRTINS